MRALVVDDEGPARRRLIRLLRAIDGVEVVGEAADGEAALAAIDRLAPDVVLLDIQMPGLDGLSVAAARPDLPPIVFTTGHDRYAVQAFEVAAVDYLLKPIRAGRLAAALERVRRRGATEAMRALLRRSDPAGPRLAARHGEVVRVLDARRIGLLQAADKYVVCAHEGVEYVLDQSLSELEDRLAHFGFMRVHRGALVDLGRVVALHPLGRAGEVELDDGRFVSVSRRLLPELQRRLGL